MRNKRQPHFKLHNSFFSKLLSSERKTVILFVLFLFAGNHLFSQTIIPIFENLGVNEGLPHSSVYSILQDKKGFMWFGTADGLCRYDGSGFISFKYLNRDEHDVSRNIVKGKILEDTKGNIWYSNESGIYKWDALKETVIRVKTFDKKEYNDAEFQCVYLDSNNSIWLFNLKHGILEFNITDVSTNQYPLSNSTSFSEFVLNFIAVDHNGNIWFRNGSSSDPYLVFDIKSRNYSVQFAENPPHAIFFEKKERILAYDDKLVYEDTEGKPTGIVPKHINGKKVTYYSFDGVRDNYNRLWMTARGKGLFYYDEKEKQFHEFHHDNANIKSLPFDLTTCLFIDRNENLWIGTDGSGVAKLDLKQPRFNLFPIFTGDYPQLNDYFTKCFYEDDKGRIWFGTQTNGLNIYDPETYKLLNFRHESGISNSLAGNIVGNILNDRDGNMWIGSSGGISLFNEKKKSFETISIENLPKLFPLINNFVNKLIQTENGDILAATTLGIIKIRMEKNGQYRGYFFNNNSYLCSLATDIEEMPDRKIYVTLRTLGLYMFEPDGVGFKHLITFLAGIDLLSLRTDDKAPGFLWIGSSIGLIHFNMQTQTYRVYDEKDGLANSHVYGSLEDLKGNFWISTNKGLSSFDRKNSTFENYSFQDGLQSNEFNSQAFYKSRTGNFYFGGVSGFNWFNPGYVGREQLKPTAVVTRIEINELIFNKDSNFLNQTITVPYDQNDFNFYFASLDYTRPVANKMLYMLQGWDDKWILADNRNARYSNLPPGIYALRLKVSNTSGLWSDEENINIHIQAPFWKRSWFFVSIIFIAVSGIFFMHFRMVQQKIKRKLRLLEKQIAIDAERSRISADMHDEIGSGISQIALLSELIQVQKKGEVELKQDILTIATSARGLVQAMSEIIWTLNPQNDTLENLLAYTREQSQKYFEPFEIQFDIYFPDEVPDIKLSNEQRRNLYLVTREALNNAMKHSGANIIQLKLDITNNDCCFSVTDNGNGMKDNRNRIGSNGLSNMKKRMEDIGGSIVWMMPGKGTIVKYCLSL